MSDTKQTVKNTSKAYGYKYASLADIAAQGHIIPQMCLRNADGQLFVFYKDASEWIQGAPVVIPELKGMNKAQAMGAAITYARRFTACLALGLACGDDVEIETKAPTEPKVEPKAEPKVETKVETKVEPKPVDTKKEAMRKEYAQLRDQFTKAEQERYFEMAQEKGAEVAMAAMKEALAKKGAEADKQALNNAGASLVNATNKVGETFRDDSDLLYEGAKNDRH